MTSLVYVFEDGDVEVRISPLVASSSGLHLVRFTATAEVGMRGGGTSVRRVATVAIVRVPGDTGPADPVAVPGTWREIMSW